MAQTGPFGKIFEANMNSRVQICIRVSGFLRPISVDTLRLPCGSPDLWSDLGVDQGGQPPRRSGDAAGMPYVPAPASTKSRM